MPGLNLEDWWQFTECWSIESNMLLCNNLLQIQIVFTICNRTAVNMSFGEGLSYLGLKCNNVNLGAAISYVIVTILLQIEPS